MKLIITLALSFFISFPIYSQNQVYQAGHPSLQHWLLPDIIPSSKEVKALSNLGKQLFFDKRLSSSAQVSCASCHIPEKGWEDGLPLSIKLDGQLSKRHSQTLINGVYTSLFTWNGKAKSLEHEAYLALSPNAFINVGSKRSLNKVTESLIRIPDYAKQFKQIYPNQGITRTTISNALAAFERTIISNNSPFDQWIKGDADAMSENQIAGFQLFSEKAKCVFCHQAPNFTDDGFHNIGLKSFGEKGHLIGRQKIIPLKMLEGAFKTPTLRGISLRAPYFHDGSADSLQHVMQHYLGKNLVTTNLSPSFNQSLKLTQLEENLVIEFMIALTSEQKPYEYPKLPEEVE